MIRMAHGSKRSVTEVMQRISRAWLEGRVDDIEPVVHPEVVMALPGFSGRTQGREEFLAGFRDFAESATIHHFKEHDQQTDVVGDTAVVTYRYELVYERSRERYRATGRDVWVFQKQGSGWLAVWRTMLDMNEDAA